MIDAFAWGLLAASSLVIGGLIALRWRIEARALGLMMAFGVGVLLSAVAYDLVQEAADVADGSGIVGIGLAARAPSLPGTPTSRGWAVRIESASTGARPVAC